MEGEAVRIRLDRREIVWVQNAPSGMAHFGAARRPVRNPVGGVQHVAHQQIAAASENPAAGVRVAEVEAPVDALASVVGVRVELRRAADELAEVAEELDVVLDARVAPDLGRRAAHVPVAVGDQLGGVVALHAAAGRIGVAVFDAQVGESALAQGQAHVAGEGQALSVPGRVAAAANLHAAAGRGVLEDEVEHAGDGVRAVLRRRSVAQHLGVPHRDGGDHGQVGALRAVGDAVRDPVDDRGAVAALAVDQHERVVRGQVAQARRAHDRAGVADRLRVDVERRHGVAQLIG